MHAIRFRASFAGDLLGFFTQLARFSFEFLRGLVFPLLVQLLDITQDLVGSSP